MPIELKTLSIKEALKIISAIMAEAERRGGKSFSIAVAGADSQIIAFAAMDKALFSSRSIAQAKAHASVAMGINTMYWENKESPVDQGNFCDPMFTEFGGGVIVDNGQEILGGIGVSGGKSAEDETLAKFGRDFIGKSIPRANVDMG
jgi:uncharacterized protein GlcG (DUF336 family)